MAAKVKGAERSDKAKTKTAGELSAPQKQAADVAAAQRGKSAAPATAKSAAAKPAARKPAGASKPAAAAAASKPVRAAAASVKPAAAASGSLAPKAPPAVLRGPDDIPAIALNLPAALLDPANQAYFDKCLDKIGFVPNVLQAYGFDMAKLTAFAAMYNDLMLAPSGLSKLEREMIAVAVSSVNRCYYCLTAHGAAVRQLSGDPVLGEQMVMNYRAARLDPRRRAILDFAVKLTESPHAVEEADRAALRAAGLSERDIWDVAAVTGFFNMSNRIAGATDMRPNEGYHAQARTPAG